ncbi:MAG: endolytic transglycosylase MltG [Pseudomonadales bacterium]
MRLLVTIALVTLLLLAALTGWCWWALMQPLDNSRYDRVVLERGEAFTHFAAALHEQGILRHPAVLTWWARLSGAATQVRAGEYALIAGDTPLVLLERLTSGKVITYQVRIVEGWTAMQALSVLSGETALRHELGGVTVLTLLEVLGLPAGHAEGLFFPDTYQYVRGDSDADILRRAYREMQSELERLWPDRDPGVPYETPYEALIAASLVEKETGRDADRPLISQVFATRLALGMRLQTDPSVIYGLGERFDGNLRRMHLREDSPYNTYRIRGLPPTPIALPGAASIEATLHPADTHYLYFVSRGDGTSHFSVTLEEHQRAVRRFQLQ